MTADLFLACALVSTAVLAYMVMWRMPRALDRRTLESLRAFGSAIELRFPFYRGRTDDVVELADRLAAAIGTSQVERQTITMGARLRDLGLVSIPYRTLNGRSYDDWTPAEREAYDRHAEVGGDMLEKIPSVAYLAPIVRNHHSRFESDGETVAVSSRILAVVTGYVRAVHREGVDAARRHLDQESGRAYDPRLVRELQHIVERSHERRRVSRSS